MRAEIPHRELRAGGARALALPAIADAVEDLLARGTLYGWASAHPERRGLGGRGEALRVPAPRPGGDGGVWVVRHFVRGGSVAAPLLGDRYLRLGTPRSFAELRASERARGRGVRTPRVLAAASYPAGPFRRGDLVTEWLPEAVDLGSALFGAEGGAAAPGSGGHTGATHAGGSEANVSRMLETAGALVRELTMAGVEHVDLNARNVLLRPRDGGLEGWVLDLDRARLHPEAVVSAGARMLARLERSLAKVAAGAGSGFTVELRAALRRGAGDLNDALGRDVPRPAAEGAP